MTDHKLGFSIAFETLKLKKHLLWNLSIISTARRRYSEAYRMKGPQLVLDGGQIKDEE